MAAAIEPVELARIVDFSERPRNDAWSLRAALVRYAQPEPQRVNDLLDLVRRTESALAAHANDIARDGPALWHALAGEHDAHVDAQLVGVLRVAQTLDHLGDVLAAWAVERAGPPPDAAVDDVIAEVGVQLERLGVPQQERPPGRRNRG